MNGRGWVIAAVMFFVGLAVGGSGVEIFTRRSANKSQQLFSQRIRCKQLADRYAKQHSDEDVGTFFLQAVDYSTVSNSCVAYFKQLELVNATLQGRYGQHEYYTWQVVDLLTGNTIYEESCGDSDSNSCWRGEVSPGDKFPEEAKAAFDEAVTGKKSPSAKRVK
jgi:hypothetical protein